MLTWNEHKHQANIAKHGMSFFGAYAVFDHPVIAWSDDREGYGEIRINLVGWLNGQVVHITYTERGDDMHIISMREAEKHEIKRYIEAVSK